MVSSHDIFKYHSLADFLKRAVMVQHLTCKQQMDGSFCSSLCATLQQEDPTRDCCLQVSYLHHRELTKPVTKTSNAWDKLAYYRIANHYKFIFKTFFDCFGYPHVIILEVSHLFAILEQTCAVSTFS